MKKKIIFVILLCLVLPKAIFAYSAGEGVTIHEGYDEYYAIAFYEGKNLDNSKMAQERFDKKVRDDKDRIFEFEWVKLTNKLTSMVFKALGQFDYRPGEVYDVMVTKYSYLFRKVELYEVFCKIHSDYSINYYAIYLKEKD